MTSQIRTSLFFRVYDVNTSPGDHITSISDALVDSLVPIVRQWTPARNAPATLTLAMASVTPTKRQAVDMSPCVIATLVSAVTTARDRPVVASKTTALNHV